MRELEGILLVDKPMTWTSFDVCNFVKKRFKIRKVGHTGTLDPQATGLLILLVGRYTRAADRLMNHTKEYRGVISLGKRTSTQDGDGEVLEELPWAHIQPADIEQIVPRFRGELLQTPPMVSALKYKGKRLYAYAREGKDIERAARTVHVHRFDILKTALPDIDFLVEVSKGTYVRTLAEDMGKALGTAAYLKSLCRTRIGPYELSESVSIEELGRLELPEELSRFLIKRFRDRHYTPSPRSAVTS